MSTSRRDPSSNLAGPPLRPPRLRTAADVDADELDRFLRRSFSDAKADFLRQHGDWWHRGAENRLVLTLEGQIAGYCALMPTTCRVGGEEVEALWWVDLVIDPAFRGHGLQRYFDHEVRARDRLLLGVPNALAAKIHRKHGWGVREDLATLLLPLQPWHLPAVRRAAGVRGLLLRGASALLTPAALLYRSWLRRYKPESARQLDPAQTATLETLADIATRAEDPRWLQTHRDLAHLRWRYAECPWPEQLRVYVSGPAHAPTWALVARRLPGTQAATPGVLRILELYGDAGQPRAMRDVVGLVLRDAAHEGLAQVTILAGPSLRRRLAPLGFLLHTRSRFCWLSPDPRRMDLIAEAEPTWGLGDSDNDDIR